MAQHFFAREEVGEKIVVSFIFGLTIIMLLPYSVGIIFGKYFKVISWVIYIVGVLSLVVVIKSFSQEIYALFNKPKKYVFSLELFHSAFLLSVIGIFIKYIYYLLIKAVTDWDAVTFYLPYARAIFLADSIPFTAFDFARFTKPMGISFLYGWIYSLSTSISAENFRLIPLSFVFITIVLIYLIAKDFCSIFIAKLAVMIYIFLPLHDSALYYYSYYPDVAYNSLILAVFYFLFKYSRTLDKRYCLISGLIFGLSMLLKAQTMLFIVPILFTFLLIFSRNSIKVFATFLTPFAFLLFLIYGKSDGNLTSFFSLFTGEGFLVLILCVIISSLVALGIKKQEKITIIDGSLFTFLKSLLLFIGASSVALVWYLRNYFTMGTFIWLSSIKESNLQWALNILSNYISQTYQRPEIFSFLLIIILVLLVHPILGSVWIIPKLVGGVNLRKSRKMSPVNNWVLGFFLAYIIYGYSTMVISPFTINPRDLVPLAPFFSIYSACGLLIMVQYFWKTRSKQVTLYLLAFLGFFSLAQSLLILYYPPSFLVGVCDQIARFSLSSWKLLAHGPPEAALNWLIFGIVTGLFLLIPLFCKKIVNYILYKKNTKIMGIISPYPKSFTMLKKVLAFVLITILFFMQQIAPYVALTYEYGNGNIMAFKENQENIIGSDLYIEIVSYLQNHTKNGDVILTIGTGLTGLQYKLDSLRFIDITFPDNLASMRELLGSKSKEDIVNILHDFNLRYFLLPKWGLGGPSGYATSFMEWLLNETCLLPVIWDPEIFAIRATSVGWILFELSDKNLPSIGWTDDSFIENIFSETKPFVIVEDHHASFWTGATWAGSGEISAPIIYDDDVSPPKGEDCGKIVFENGTGRWRIYHAYETKQDWRDFEIISLFWYGANTGKTLSIYIDAPDPTNRWIIPLTEDWIGWKRIQMSLDDFKVGSPSKSEVKRIAIGFYNEDNVSGTWYIDRLIVDDMGQGDWKFTNNPQSEGLNHTFSSDGAILNFTVSGKVNSYAQYKYSAIPLLSTNEYPYVVCLVKGTENARWLFRLFFEDGTSYDFPYWGKPTENWGLYLFDMSSVPSLSDKVLRYDAYLAVKTTDGKTASVYIDYYQIQSD